MAIEQKAVQAPRAHRLHISGLTPQITPADLKERFQRFGDVQTVDAVGPDALGQPRNFVYMTINAKQQDLTKCINSMQNSIWRGAKLKIAPAKMSFEDRLATERLTEAERRATLDEKAVRKLRIKERKDRKRRLARAGGGRQSGDMRIMTLENWKTEGDIWRGKYWRLTPSQHLIRPIFTRPTHPLHMKPVSTASDDIEPVAKAGKVDPYAALGTLGKKTKKPRCLPPKRAMRMLLDPYRYGQMHLSGAILNITGSDNTSAAEGVWDFVYDDVRFDDIGSRTNPVMVSGKWIYHSQVDTVVSAELQQSDEEEVVEEVPGRRKRVAKQLEQIAASSTFPDTLTDVDSEPTAKKVKFVQPSNTPKRDISASNRKFALDDDDMPALDDDDIWGEEPSVTEHGGVSLFDTVPAALPIRKGPLKAVIIPAEVPSRKTSLTSPPDDLSDVDLDDTDALFGAAVGDATVTPSSPLFQAEKSTAKASTSHKPLASQPSSDDEAEQSASTGVGLSLTKFARAEKQKGMSVLQSLGIDFGKTEGVPEIEDVKEITFSDDEDTPTASKTMKPTMAWLYDDEEDEGDISPAVPRLRGGGDDASKDHDSDSSDSDTDSGTESDEDDSSSDDEDKADAQSVAVDKQGGKQSLKDMFAAHSEPTGFSLMAGLDLELDSDLEMDEANPFQAPSTKPQEPLDVATFAPVPTVDVNAVFNAASSTEPFFFATTGRPMAQKENLQEGWMGKITVGGMEKEEVEVQPFWKTETDEQMAQLWNEQKRELTQDYKKRHREAVKRQKRGMGGAGSSAANGGMDVD